GLPIEGDQAQVLWPGQLRSPATPRAPQLTTTPGKITKFVPEPLSRGRWQQWLPQCPNRFIGPLQPRTLFFALSILRHLQRMRLRGTPNRRFEFSHCVAPE
ncbi:hypothetical protein, partial [Nocardia amamiensis]|uniref:hypothetical protein n=1 Tax=Nocardia amamiensis TaxID=404578 RepID=UPI001E404956